MLLPRLSIKARTFLAMALMVGLVLFVALLTFSNGAEQKARSDEIRDTPLRVLNWSHRLAAGISKLQVLVLQHVVADDQDSMEKLEAKIAFSLSEIDALWIDYDNGPAVVPILAAEVEQTRALWVGFRPQVQSAMPLSSSGQKLLAKRLVQRDLSSLGRDILAHLERLVTLSASEAALAFDAADDAYWRQVWHTLVLVGIGCALAMVLSWGIVRSLGQLTRSVVDPVLAMAEGRLDPTRRTHDRTELGRITGAIEALQQSLIAARDLQEQTEERRAYALAERQRLLVGIAADIDSHVGDLLGAMMAATASLEGRAQDMLASASVAATEGEAVATSVEVTSNNIQIVAAASEELAAVAEGIASETQGAAVAAARALDAVRLSEEQAGELLSSANEIGAVVQLVNTVAAQTNLLALNATIEAARAGDAGRGFAVVAGEVKLLAEETARATGRITEQVDRLQRLARRSAELTRDMKSSVEASNAFSLNVRVASDEQRAAITEIASRIEETAIETERVSASIAAVHETIISSRQLAEAIVSTSGQVVRHSDGLAGGLRRLKAALGAA